jgi:catechol 2,3-dioxygenase-like lactoylglutathione lyase family enzyme
MVIYAFLGNTLFLTVLVSILSNTFSKIAADATAEIQFRRAVLTFEGVKSGPLFAYRPPFNLLAFVVLLPLKFLLSPRWFHKINITAVRILNFPILLAISYHERRALWKPRRRLSVSGPGPSKRSFWMGDWGFWHSWKQLSPHADLQAVFEEEPPQGVVALIEEEDDLEDAILENSFAATGGVGGRSVSPGSAMTGRRTRRLSSVWPGPSA